MSTQDPSPVAGAGSSVAAVVLCYHPDAAVIGNVHALLQQVSRVFVINNSPDAQTAAALAPLAAEARVTVIDQAGNVGVGAGFNAGMRTAQERASSVPPFARLRPAESTTATAESVRATSTR